MRAERRADDLHGRTPPEEGAVAEEALARMQEQMTQAAALSHQGARAALQAQLDQNDEEGEAQRRALNGYLEELKGREDEAGDRIRAAEFTQEVDALVEEQRRAAADAAGPHVHDIIQHVHDPATFEALLEVQRLDEALESVPTTARQQQQQQQQQQQDAPPSSSKRGQQQQQPPSRNASARKPAGPSRKQMAEAAELAAIGGGALTPLLPPTANGQGGGGSSSRSGSAQKRIASTAPATLASVTASDSTFLTEQPGGGINDEVRALADEVARLKGIADRRRDPDTMSEASMSTMSASGSRRKGGIMNSASAIHGRAKEGHKSIGGVWMTAEDEARVDALLAEELAELEAAEGMMIQVPYGEGFMPCEEERGS